MAELSRPEFFPGSASEDVFNTLKKRGAVLLRQILPPHLLTDLLPRFQQGFAAEDRLFISGQMLPEIYQNFYYYGHAEPNQIANYYAWITGLLQEGELKRVLQAIYGSEAFILVNKSFYMIKGNIC